jgi:HPt (histidine-containing phosphotransfer) domain-containing protein
MYEPGHTPGAALNPQRLADLFGDDREAMCEVLGLAIDNVAQLARQLTVLLSAGDRVEAATVAHEIKGVCANIGAEELAALAAGLQTALQRSSVDQIGAGSLLEAYERFVASAKTMLAS